MTVSSDIASHTFSGDGLSTVFTCPFGVLDDDDMQVFLITLATGAVAQLTKGADYSVSGVGTDEAVVTTTTAYSAAYQIRCKRSTQRVQETDYTETDAFPASAHEQALDRLTYIAQELAEAISRSIRVPDGETLDELASATARASKLLGFTSTGALTTVTPDDQSAAALALLLASSSATEGSDMIGVYDARAPGYLKTLSDIVNGLPVSLLRFINRTYHAGIIAGSSAQDIAANFQEAIDALNTGQDTVTGGTIYLPRGLWNLSTKVLVRTGHVDALTSLRIVGDGMHNTKVNALGGFAGTSMLELTEPTYCTVEGLHLYAGGNAAICLDVLAGSEITLRDVFAQGASGQGMRFTNCFMMLLERLRAKSNGTGFQFVGPHTSIDARALYALNNTLAGFDIADIVYSHFSACGSDTNREGYVIRAANGLKLTACGAEACTRAAFHFEASAAQDATTQNANGIRATLEDCFSFDNTGTGGYGSSIYSNQADTSAIDVTLRGFRELTSPGGSSIVMAGVTTSHKLRISEDSVFNGTVSGAASASERRAARYGSAVYDPPNLADGAGATTTVTVNGIQFGDYCEASFSANLQGITVTAWVSAANTVSVRFQNESGGALDLASGTLRVKVTPLD